MESVIFITAAEAEVVMSDHLGNVLVMKTKRTKKTV